MFISFLIAGLVGMTNTVAGKGFKKAYTRAGVTFLTCAMIEFAVSVGYVIYVFVTMDNAGADAIVNI